MMKTIAVLSVLLASLVSAADFLPLRVGDYTLEITEEVGHPKVRHPSDNIPNAEYRPAKAQKTLRLRFSEDRKKVEVLPRGVSGVPTPRTTSGSLRNIASFSPESITHSSRTR